MALDQAIIEMGVSAQAQKVAIERVIPVWTKERAKDLARVFFDTTKPHSPEFKDEMIQGWPRVVTMMWGGT